MEFVGCTAATVMKAGEYYRLTLEGNWYTLDFDFRLAVPAVWDALAGTQLVWPVSPRPNMEGLTVGVIDAKVSTPGVGRTVGEMARAVHSLTTAVDVREVRKLSSITNATGSTGASEREQQVQTVSEKQSHEGLGVVPDAAKRAADTLATVAKWTLVVVLVVGLAYAGTQANKLRGALGR